MFTIELRSRGDVKSASLDDDDKVLIEGSIGSLQRARFLEDLVLELTGSRGVLRVDLSVKDLHLRPHKADGSKEDGGSGQ